MTMEGPELVGSNERQTRVFISYSRKDSDFAQALREALMERGFEAYLDQHDIAPGEPWRERLSGLISTADTVIFCLSANFVASKICDWEVNEAERLGKRLLPVVPIEPDADKVPQRLKRLNYIFMRTQAEFVAGLKQLITVLEVDIGWVREHTRLGELAERWEKARILGAQPLRSRELEAAERWLADRPPKAPAPTDTQKAYIRASRKSQTKAQRRNVALSLGAVVIALGLAGAAFWQSLLATKNEQRAQRERDTALINQSRLLADKARQEINEGDATTGLLLSLESLADTRENNNRPYVAAADATLNKALNSYVETGRIVHPKYPILTFKISPDSQFILTTSFDNTIILSDSETGKLQHNVKGHACPKTLKYYRCKINNAEFSPASDKIVTTSLLDKDALVFDVNTGGQTARLHGHEKRLLSAWFSNDGSRIVTSSTDHTVRIWQTETGKQIISFPGRSSTPSNNRKKIVIITPDKTAEVWDIQGNKKLLSLKGQVQNMASAKFSRDGKLILTTSTDNTIRVWDAGNGTLLQTLPGDKVKLNFSRFSPRGRFVMVGYQDNRFRLWNVKDGQLLATLNGKACKAGAETYECGAKFARFSNDERRLLTVYKDNTAQYWDTESSDDLGKGIELNQLKKFKVENRRTISGAHFSLDGRRMLTWAHRERAIYFWDVETGKKLATIKALQGVTGATYTPNGKSVITKAYSSRTAWIWHNAPDRQIKKLRRPYCLQEGRSKSCPFSGLNSLLSPQGTYVIASEEIGGQYRNKVWNLKLEKIISTLKGNNSLLFQSWESGTAQFSDNEETLVTITGTEKVARIWDVKSGLQIGELKGHSGVIGNVRYSFGSKFIVTSSDDMSIRVWNAQTAAQIAVLSGPEGVGSQVSISADGTRVLDRLDDNTARLWNVETGKQIALVSVDDQEISYFEFSPDGKRFYISTLINNIQLRSATSGKLIKELTSFISPGVYARFSPDGAWLVSTNPGGPAHVWDAFHGELQVHMPGKWSIYPIFSRDGSRVLTTSDYDTSLTIWELPSGQPLITLEGLKAKVMQAAFLEDGKALVTSSEDGSLTTWDIRTGQHLVDLAKRITFRCLSRAQRNLFHLPPEPPAWCHEMKKWPYHKGRDTPVAVK